MASWHVDEGLAVLIGQWKREQPGAVVYTIGDEDHTTGEHVPERQGSAAGADLGEVDAADFMPGHGVTEAELAELRGQLLRERDARLMYVIWHDLIVSSVVQPWTVRKYLGKWHDHLHVSVNDRFDRNTEPWDLEADVRTYTMAPLPDGLKLPELRVGDEDLAGKTEYVTRAQRLLKVDDDGVYGAVTAAALAKRMKGQTGALKPSSTNGGKLYLPEWRVLYALW